MDQDTKPKRRKRRIGPIPLIGFACVLALLGAMLIRQGLQTTEAHPQPLPANPFDLDPSAAGSLPGPAPIAQPQDGSVVDKCEQTPGAAEISIPSLCVYAPLVQTHSVDGSMIVPTDVRSVGISTDSAPLSATAGTTLIVGHVDDYRQGNGAFYFIHDIEPGADIAVVGADGTVTQWKVFKVTSVSKSALPLDIFDTAGPRQLVLVTCGGPLLRTGGGATYADNVLVYATPAA